jgi:GTPase SAR1 family protein
MFDLKSISKTRRVRAPKIVIVGQGKIGKTTFAAMAPRAIGILTEDGADAVDANAFPLAMSLADVYSAMDTLINQDHEFQTLFIDSLDWLEPLVQDHVCKANNWKNIEQPGFGKGYVAAAEEWRNLLSGLEVLRADKGMGIILIAHDKIKRIEDPLTEGFDSHVLKLHDRAASLVQEWADVIGYAGYRIFTSKTDAGFGNKETKATTTGERILHVEPHPAHCGGNRFGLSNMPLDWAAFQEALTAAQS